MKSLGDKLVLVTLTGSAALRPFSAERLLSAQTGWSPAPPLTGNSDRSWRLSSAFHCSLTHALFWVKLVFHCVLSILMFPLLCCWFWMFSFSWACFTCLPERKQKNLRGNSPTVVYRDLFPCWRNCDWLISSSLTDFLEISRRFNKQHLSGLQK